MSNDDLLGSTTGVGTDATMVRASSNERGTGWFAKLPLLVPRRFREGRGSNGIYQSNHPRQTNLVADPPVLKSDWATFHELATEYTAAQSDYHNLRRSGTGEQRTIMRDWVAESGKKFAKACKKFRDRLDFGCSDLEPDTVTSDKQEVYVQSISQAADLISTHTRASRMPTQTEIWDTAVEYNYRSLLEPLWRQATSAFDQEDYTEALTEQTKALAKQCVTKSQAYIREKTTEAYLDLQYWAQCFDCASATLEPKVEAEAERTSLFVTSSTGIDWDSIVQLLKTVRRAESYPDPPKRLPVQKGGKPGSRQLIASVAEHPF